MCGIVGYTGFKPAAPILLQGLARLEYRGYDSAGLALLRSGQPILTIKKAGKIHCLVSAVQEARISPVFTSGLGHTRWATHGLPVDKNAHPHSDCRNQLAVVHNGIIENYRALKRRLRSQGHVFKSDTDSEVLAHLLEQGLRRKGWVGAVRWALAQVQGTYSVVMGYGGEPEKLIGAKSGGGALVVGLGRGENFLASDIPALLSHTRRFFYLQDGELAVVSPSSTRVLRLSNGRSVTKRPLEVDWSVQQAEKEGYAHFMLKEILEQPRALKRTLAGRLDPKTGEVKLEGPFWSSAFLRRFRNITLLGMGTSAYAGMIGRDLLEKYLRVPAQLENASEFRYRKPPIGKDSLVIVLSQSGETVDTLVALREAKAQGATIIAICNAMGSSATREADGVLLTHAGPEIGVASTKAFTAQLGALWFLTLYLARLRRTIPPGLLLQKGRALGHVPRLMQKVLRQRHHVARLARKYAVFHNFLFLGRGIQYPIALEAALKLKEISYIHAEGYPAGEMKHGPIALIDRRMPVVAMALRSSTAHEKMLNNLMEVRARSGRLIALVEKGDREARRLAEDTLELPPVEEDLGPFVSILPLQLFAYEVARRKGCEIDQPRHLAKSVTVE